MSRYRIGTATRHLAKSYINAPNDQRTLDRTVKLVKKILVPIDGSGGSRKALEYVIEEYKSSKAALTLLHVVHTPVLVPMGPAYGQFVAEMKKVGNGYLKEAAQLAEKSGVSAQTAILEDPSVPNAIVEYARNESCDLIVMGTRGRTGVQAFLLGSVAMGVSAHAHCPVVLVR